MDRDLLAGAERSLDRVREEKPAQALSLSGPVDRKTADERGGDRMARELACLLFGQGADVDGQQV